MCLCLFSPCPSGKILPLHSVLIHVGSMLYFPSLLTPTALYEVRQVPWYLSYAISLTTMTWQKPWDVKVSELCGNACGLGLSQVCPSQLLTHVHGCHPAETCSGLVYPPCPGHALHPSQDIRNLSPHCQVQSDLMASRSVGARGDGKDGTPAPVVAFPCTLLMPPGVIGSSHGQR